MEKKLVIIDGSSLLYRAFYALPPTMTSPDGIPTNAVYGFLRMLLGLYRDLDPEYMAVTFDKDRHTFRTEMYEGYKATRKPAPDELVPQFDLIRDVMQVMGVAVYSLDGYEGDDILGTLSLRYEKEMPVNIVTGDRDALQLSSSRTTVFLTQKGITNMAAMTPEGNLNGDVVQESFPSIHQANPMAQKPGTQHPANGIPAGLTAQADEDESVSVHVSIRITQRVYGNQQQPGNGYYSNGTPAGNGNYHSNPGHKDADIDRMLPSSEEEPAKSVAVSPSKPRNWALKAGIGTSLPKGNFHMPFTAGVSVERCLNKHFSLEAGLQYNCLDGDHTLHTLGIPVRLNMMLASTPKVDFYAMVGGAAEKCIAGAPDNGFGAEPVQLSVAAGVGVRYKMNNRFALFAEPSVSHHFDTDSQTRTLRTERPTNLNLLCGVRMTY